MANTILTQLAVVYHPLVFRVSLFSPLTPGDYHAPTHPWHPRTAPRPTDQISGELKEPALSAWLGIDPYIDPTTDDSADIPFAPVTPPDANPPDTLPTDTSP